MFAMGEQVPQHSLSQPAIGDIRMLLHWGHEGLGQYALRIQNNLLSLTPSDTYIQDAFSLFHEIGERIKNISTYNLIKRELLLWRSSIVQSLLVASERKPRIEREIDVFLDSSGDQKMLTVQYYRFENSSTRALHLPLQEVFLHQQDQVEAAILYRQDIHPHPRRIAPPIVPRAVFEFQRRSTIQ